MGLENLKSIFQEELKSNIERFSSNVITNVNDTKLTQFITPPLNQLIGESPIQGMSWESLYDSNHSPKDNPSHKGLIPINYPNVSRDNLNIRSTEDGRFGFGGSFRTSAIGAVGKLIGSLGLGGNVQQFLQDTGKEPYIVSSIGKGGRRINSNFGGRGLPVERGITDALRISKYLTSPSGLLFIAKQNALALQTPNRLSTSLDNAGMKDFGTKANSAFNQFYNPLSTLLNTVGRAGIGTPAALINKTEPGLGSILDITEYNSNFRALVAPKNKSPLAEIIDSTRDGGVQDLSVSDLLITDKSPIRDNKYGNDVNPHFRQTSEPYPKVLGLKSLHDTFRPKDDNSDSGFGGDKHTLLEFGIRDTESPLNTETRPQYKDKIEEAHPNSSTDGTIEGSENGMPFYFKDMRDGAYLFFRAYIEGLSENIGPTYNPTQYIGRSEPVYTYAQTERDINFTLKLFAQTKDELKAIYKKMNKLTSMCYPEYFKDERLDDNGVPQSYGNRMKPPLTKMRIGEIYGSANSELMGYIKSLSYTVDQTSPFETEVGKRVPMHVVATIGYQVIHSETPNLETKFYGYIGG